MSVTAQEKTANIEQLRKDMYRLFNKPDSIDKFMQVTDQLIEVSKQKTMKNCFIRLGQTKPSCSL